MISLIINIEPFCFNTTLANALGYHRNARTEDGIDPNRDFPYDLYNPSLCMRTIAGRTLNEIFREHQFQMALTFHGGVEVVAYEWGAPSWYGSLSPDDESQNQIAAAYSKYGGTWDGTRPYEYGTMNDMVYYVRGGMEDWAYAGSWDTDRVLACQPTTYGGYPSDKTKYNNSTLRAFNMLIETSNEKNPYYNLGSSEDLLNEKSTGSGHISRNIRLSLLSADLVEPYVTIVQVNDILLQRDVVPLTWSADCGGSITVDGNSTGITNNNQLTITFSVGGALTIDQVDLWYANKKDSGAIGDCFKQPTMASLQAFAKATMVGRTRGTGRFSNSGPTPSSSDGLSAGPLFVGVLDIPPNTGGSSEWVVMASARVDQDWSMVPNNAGAPTNHVQQPQSHMANVRTNPNWRHESDDGKLIQGRLDWFSQPLTVVVPPNNIPTTPVPTDAPTKSPTLLPSISVSKLSSTSKPTGIPTDAPSIRASSSPSLRPNSSGTTREPTISPTTTPSIPPVAMTSSPSELETQEPTLVPSWNGDGDQNDDDDDGGLLSSSEPSSTSTSQTPTFSPSHSSDISNSPSQLPTARGNIRSSSSDPTNDVLFNATLLPSLSPAIPPSNDASSARQSLLFRSHAIVGMILVSSLVQTLI